MFLQSLLIGEMFVLCSEILVAVGETHSLLTLYPDSVDEKKSQWSFISHTEVKVCFLGIFQPQDTGTFWKHLFFFFPAGMQSTGVGGGGHCWLYAEHIGVPRI